MAASVGTVWVDVRLNMAGVRRELQAGLTAAAAGAGVNAGAAAGAGVQRGLTQSLAGIGTKMQGIGRQMSMGLTLPLALIGKSAVTSFKAFDEQMTMVNSLVGESVETTDRWRGEVRELGLTYGVAAEEAAAGLYYITSSGVSAINAMSVLEQAIKGSAVGLGETKVVADVLTSAMNAYGSANMTAAKAGDILTVAVKRGKGEADELAGALSQVIPIAANLGVNFGEVAGAMSAMTLSGTSADQAATQLRGLFNTLQDMPPIAQRALTAYTGLTKETVQHDLKTKGLVVTLKKIYDGFGANKVAIAEVFGNIRAMTGIMNLFGQNTERTLDIVREVTEASGDLNEAWEITAESKAKKLDIAMNTIHDSMVGLGAELVPMVTGVAGAIGTMASMFGSLPGPVKTGVTALGGMLAVAGPLTYAVGSLVRAGSAISGVLERAAASGNGFASTASKLSGTLMKGAGAATLGAVAWSLWANKVADATRRGAELQELVENQAKTGGIVEAEDTMTKARTQIEGLEKEIEDFRNVSPVDVGKMIVMPWTGAKKALDFDYFTEDLPKQVEGMKRANETIQKRIDLSKRMNAETGRDADAIYRWIIEQEKAGVAVGTYEEVVTAMVEGLAKGDAATTELSNSNVILAGSFDDIAAKAKATADLFFAVTEAEGKLADAQDAVADARQKVTDAEQGYRDSQMKTLDAERKIGEAQRKAVEASNKLRDARLNLADAQRRAVDASNELNDALSGPSEDEQINVESAELSLAQARKATRGKFDDPLDRRRAQLDVRRAVLDLERAKGEHGARIAEAQKGVADAQRDIAGAQDAVNNAIQAELDAREAIIDARNAKAAATVAEARALDEIATARTGVADAELAAFDAAMGLAGAQSALNIALLNGTTNGTMFLEYLENLRGMYPGMATVIDDYARKFREIQGAAALAAMQEPPAIPPVEPVPVAPAPAPAAEPPRGAPTPMGEGEYIPGVGYRKKRAFGGPLGAGQLSTVNERGMPELWSANGKQYLLPLNNGQVTPLKPLDVDVAPRGGDGTTVGDVYVQGVQDPVQTAYEVRRQLRAKTRTKGRT